MNFSAQNLQDILHHASPQMIHTLISNPNVLNALQNLRIEDTIAENVTKVLTALSQENNNGVLTPEQEQKRFEFADHLDHVQFTRGVSFSEQEFKGVVNGAILAVPQFIQQFIQQQITLGISASVAILEYLDSHPEDEQQGVPNEILYHLQRIYIREKPEGNQFECSICLTTHIGKEVEVLESVKNVKTMIKLTCNHIFDEDCILTWLSKRATCPMCRASV